MTGKIHLFASGSTFQNFDGTNFTTIGCEAKTNFGLSAYIGLGADFKDKSTGVFDLKYSGKYAPNSIIGFNGRARTKVGENEQSTQLRVSPLSVNIPLDKKTSAYVTPCYCAKYDYSRGSWNHSATVFAGITYKIDDKTSISAEIQNYNTQNMFNGSQEFFDGKNWSGNLIISRKL